jgi:hypothetical protein
MYKKKKKKKKKKRRKKEGKKERCVHLTRSLPKPGTCKHRSG